MFVGSNANCVLWRQEGGFLTALEFSDRRKMCFRITTGSLELELVYCCISQHVHCCFTDDMQTSVTACNHATSCRTQVLTNQTFVAQLAQQKSQQQSSATKVCNKSLILASALVFNVGKDFISSV